MPTWRRQDEGLRTARPAPIRYQLHGRGGPPPALSREYRAIWSWALHQDLVGEGLSIGAGCVQRVTIELTEPQLFCRCRLVWKFIGQQALWRAAHGDRLVLGK